MNILTFSRFDRFFKNSLNVVIFSEILALCQFYRISRIHSKLKYYWWMEPNSFIKYLSIRRFVDCSVMLEISLNNSFTGGSNLHLVMIISWRQINQLYDIFKIELEFTVFSFKCCLFSIEFFFNYLFPSPSCVLVSSFVHTHIKCFPSFYIRAFLRNIDKSHIAQHIFLKNQKLL